MSLRLKNVADSGNVAFSRLYFMLFISSYLYGEIIVFAGMFFWSSLALTELSRGYLNAWDPNWAGQFSPYKYSR